MRSRTIPGHSGCWQASCNAFTLLEILLVVGIMAILMALAASSTSSVLRSVKLNQAGTLLTSQLSLARQMAISRNAPVAVRFIRPSGSNVPFSKIQLLQSNRPLTKAESLPEAVGISVRTELSSLMNASSEQTASAGDDPPVPGLGHNYRFVQFNFHPKGNLNLDISKKWFATVVPETPDTPTPANFISVQIDPVTGGLSVYRP